MQGTLVLNVCNCIRLSGTVLNDAPAGKYNRVALIRVRKSGLCHLCKYYISSLLLCNFRMLSSPIEQPVSTIQENNRCYSVVYFLILKSDR